MRKFFSVILLCFLISAYGQVGLPIDTLQSNSTANDSLAIDSFISPAVLPPGQYIEYIESFYIATETLKKNHKLS